MLAQTCPDWRLLIIAEDGNFAALDELLENELNDPRTEMIRSEKWQLAGKLNAGMNYANTDFTAILLGDDMWSPDAVAVLTAYIEKFPEADFLHSSRVFINEDDRPISSVYYSKENFDLSDFVMTSPVKHLLCWRRDKALALGGIDESIHFVGPDDYDFPWSMAEAGAVFKAVREPLYLHRDHRDGYRLTTHVPMSEQIRETKRILRKHGVNRADVRRKIKIAKRSYLRQCIYRSKFDKWLKEKLGYDARRGWREKYG
jgi:glycosyltransferase involved in cell wall biosynthesis